ncbi:MAG: hypothetical protein EA400_10295 [Chromatiaceae bacterium]|nr:MAG: hypothetical protein EA400_10295 [Chromatiaceae bacterium]
MRRWSRLLPGLLLTTLVATPALAQTQTQTQARFGAQSVPTTRGWTQLDQEQRTERQRAAPLDLREQRELDRRERSQRNDLRAAEQRAWRERDRRRYPYSAAQPPLQPPAERHLQRQRLHRHLQREIQPYRRRR